MSSYHRKGHHFLSDPSNRYMNQSCSALSFGRLWSFPFLLLAVLCRCSSIAIRDTVLYQKLGFARRHYQDMAEKTSETAPAVSDHTETPKLVGEAISPDTHEKGLIKPSSPAASSSTSENGDAAALEKAEQAVEGPKSPRDIHGVKWALAVISTLAVTFLFVSTMIIIFSPPRSPT